MQKLLGATLIGCLLLGAFGANAQPEVDADWVYLTCESETEQGTCEELEAFVPFVSRCVVVGNELQSQGWSLLTTEGILNRTTLQIFKKGFDSRIVYCRISIEIDD